MALKYLCLFLPLLPLAFSFIPVNTTIRQLPEASRLCYRDCEFKFCDSATDLLIGLPAQPSQAICHKFLRIGAVLQTSEAEIFRSNERIRISSFSSQALTVSESFERNFFLVGEAMSSRHISGIDAANNIGNQWLTLDGECVVLGINKYELRSGRNYRTITSNRRAACIAFRVMFPDIAMELFWDNRADMDIQITEPDGTIVDFENPRSRCGKLVEDSKAGDCSDPNQRYVGHERVVYDRNCEDFQFGTYVLSIRQHRKCSGSETKYFVAAAANGKIIRSKNGQTSYEGANVVDTLTFSIVDE